MRLMILLGVVVLTLLAAAPLAPPAAAAPRPTPTVKACHICEEWEETVTAVDAQATAVAAQTPQPSVTPCGECWRVQFPPTGPTVFPAATTTPASVAGAIQSIGNLASAGQDQPVVRGVMFWMEGCGHCEEVLTGVLPALQGQYGSQLDIQLLEVVTLDDINRLYDTAAALGVPKEKVGVPFLILGNDALVGSQQIPQEMPALVAQHLAAGGVDYPDLALLAGLLPDPTLNDQACAPTEACAEEPEALVNQAAPDDRAAVNQPTAALSSLDAGFAEDLATTPVRPNGFGLAIAIMAGMVAALVYSVASLVRLETAGLAARTLARLEWLFLPLALAGLAVALYLSYVETQMVEAVCGPVGDCNTVQSSPYSRLFGLIPIGVIGAAGYVAILAAWLVSKRSQGALATAAAGAVFGFSLFGVLFSLYLTYLEPFVIGAVCIWCLTSAVIITLLMLLSLGPLQRRMTEEIDDA